jgi:hypothetical protein
MAMIGVGPNVLARKMYPMAGVSDIPLSRAFALRAEKAKKNAHRYMACIYELLRSSGISGGA